MEGFIDRLAELLKSLFAGDRGSQESTSWRRPPVDPDVQAAWEELEEYMRTGASGAREGSASGRSESGGRSAGRPRVDESLRQDYANLEVPFGADMEEVRASYKRMMLKYHPDRYPGDPEKQRLALEIAKKINQSFERIRRSS